MLREILQALKGTDALDKMISQVGDMLTAGQWMFERASEVLMRKVDWKGAADELYARDKKINQIEQAVREQIVTHLSMGHQADLSGCLILMSVVKDAERIGDYCKNIFEVGRIYRREYTRPEYSLPLDDIRTAVVPLFDQAREAFVTGQRKQARRVLDTSGGITKRCDLIIQQLLIVHEQLAPDEAVAYVLLSRFYKRVAAHLANIATSVVSPIPMLDYRGKMQPPEAEAD
jgi:phosphate uptake regulator